MTLVTLAGLAFAGAGSLLAQGVTTKPAFFVAEFEVTDPDGLQPYRMAVESTFTPFGGRFAVRGGEVTSLEGDPVKGRIVVIRFDSLERAKAWYDSPAYRELRPIRWRSARTRAYIVEGAAP